MKSNQQITSPNRVQSFLWWASGVTASILARYPTDHRKYSAIGATMLLIPLLATFSFGFALQQSFDSPLASVIGGIAFGTLIFNVDRLLLINIRKQEGNGMREIFMALPRLLMILVLSILITEPLLQKLLESEIANQLSLETRQYAERAREDALKSFGVEIGTLEKENESLGDGLTSLRKERSARREEYIAEGEGTAGTGKRGKGALYEEKKAAYELTAQEYEDAKTATEEAVARNNARLKELRGEFEAIVSEAATSKSNAKGFLARHTALWAIVRNDPGAAFLYFTLSLALVLLESTPLTVKLFSKRGHYDQLLETVEQERIFEEKKNLEESKARLTSEHVSRVACAEAMQQLKKDKFEQIAEAIRRNEHGRMEDGDAEITVALMSAVKRSILDDFSSGSSTTEQEAGEGQVSDRPSASPTSLLIHIHEPEEEFFTVNFNLPEQEIKGDDLLFSLRGMEDLLPQSAARHTLTSYRVVSDGGKEIEINKPLFAQLAGRRVIHLTLDTKTQYASDSAN